MNFYQVYAMYDDDQALSVEKLTRARLSIKAVVTLSTGQLRNLPEIIVPPQGEYQFMVNAGGYQRIYNEFDQWMEQQAEEVRYKPFRTSGVHHFRVRLINLLFLIQLECEKIYVCKDSSAQRCKLNESNSAL